MTFEIYQPAPALLPEEGPRREFRTRKSSDRRDPSPLRDEEYAQYDTRTLFYDVFRREEDPRRVVAIGPPAVNLMPELRALRISRAGRALRHRLFFYPLFMVVELTLDRGAAAQRELEIDFTFPSFAVRARVPACAEEAPAPRPRGGGGKGLLAAQPITMMAMQKDNQIIWIEDWCRWHHRLHDIARFRLYDNASANIGALEEALRRLGAEMDITLVRWPYPFGPTRSNMNRFTQTGAFNHGRLRFGARDAWCLTMDVDEYLAASGESSLRDVLVANERRGTVSLRMDSFTVPAHPGQAPAPERRVWRHAWRGRGLRGFSEKCIFVPSRCAYNRLHYALPANRLFTYCARWPGLDYWLLDLWHRRIPQRIESLERRGSRRHRVGAWWLRRILPGTRRGRLAPVDELFFFHFHALNTDWKPPPRSERVEPFDPERHTKDPRIRALAEQAGLVPASGADMPEGGDAPADAREGTRA